MAVLLFLLFVCVLVRLFLRCCCLCVVFDGVVVCVVCVCRLCVVDDDDRCDVIGLCYVVCQLLVMLLSMFVVIVLLLVACYCRRCSCWCSCCLRGVFVVALLLLAVILLLRC